MRKFLALVMAFFLFVPGALALELPYGEDTVLSVMEMTGAQRALAELLYEPIFRHEERIELPEGTLYDDVPLAMQCLMLEHPEMFHLGRNYTLGYYRDKPEYAMWVEPQYRMSAAEAADLRAQLYQQAAMMVRACPDAEALHDMLCSMTVYGGETEMCHTAVGALLQGQAICEGYAQALTLLYRMAGIPCGIISGTAVDTFGGAERHAWNIAYLDGYALIDSTWNDQDAQGYITHWFYGLSTAQMAADHFPDEGQKIPYCGDQNNWHRLRGHLVYTRADADAAIRRLVRGETLDLRIPPTSMYEALAKDTFNFLSEYNERNPQEAFYGTYSVIFADTQQCMIIQRAEE